MSDEQIFAPAIHERKPHLTGWRLNAGDEHVVFDARHCQIVNVQCGGGTGRNYNQASDIARLVAAAPELLAHLKFAVALLGPLCGGTAQLEAMRAAITKAEG